MLNKYAKELRNNPTDAERLLWSHLRKRQINNCKFRRQQVLGNYIVDFVSFDHKIIIELDGGQHQEQHTYDAARTVYLGGLGYQVLRFWNHDVMNDTEAVLSSIYTVMINST